MFFTDFYLYFYHHHLLIMALTGLAGLTDITVFSAEEESQDI